MLGVDVRWQNTDLIPQERHVLVSNHITTGDMMMLYKRPERTIHLISSTVPERVTQVIGANKPDTFLPPPKTTLTFDSIPWMLLHIEELVQVME